MSSAPSDKKRSKKGGKKKDSGNAALKIGVRVGVVLVLGTLIVLAIMDRNAKAKAFSTGQAMEKLINESPMKSAPLKDLEELIEGDPEISDGKDTTAGEAKVTNFPPHAEVSVKFYRWSFVYLSDHVIKVTYHKGSGKALLFEDGYEE
jgi:hypothetical protein